MIVILKSNTASQSVQELVTNFKSFGLDVHISQGSTHTILGLIGDTGRLDMDQIRMFNCVEDVKRIQEPFKNANRKFHPLNTVIPVKDAAIGGGSLTVIAGPCSVESEDHHRCPQCKIFRRQTAAWRSLQAPHFPLRLSGVARRGDPVASGSQKGYRFTHRYRDHGSFAARSLCRSGCHSGRCPQYAEF